MNSGGISYESIIKTFKIEVTSADDNNAKELQQELSTIINTEVFKKIELLIEQKTPNNLIYKLKKLELFIGEIPRNELQEKMPKKITEALEDALTKIFQQDTEAITRSQLVIAPLSKNNHDLFIYYLEKGNFPWWFKPDSDFNIDNYVREILKNQPQAARNTLFNIAKQGNVRKRIAYQFDEVNIKQIIKIVEPQEADFIISYHKTIVYEEMENKPAVLQTGQFKKAVWHFILNYLLAERGSVFNKKEFLKNNLNQISVSYNIELNELTNIFYTSLDAVEIESSVKLSIKSILAELNGSIKKTNSNDRSFAEELFNKTTEADEEDSIAMLLHFLKYNSLSDKYAGIPEKKFGEKLCYLIQVYPATVLQLFYETGTIQNSAWLHILGTQKQVLNAIESLFKNHRIKDLVEFAGKLFELTDKPIAKRLYDKTARNFLQYIFTKGTVSSPSQVSQIMFNLFTSLTQDERILFNNHIGTQTNIGKYIELKVIEQICTDSIVGINENQMPAIELQKGVSDYLLFLVQYGAIPWWGRIYEQRSPYDLFSLLIQQSIKTAKQVLIFSGITTGRKKRFVNYLGEKALFLLIDKVEPNLQLQSILSIVNTNIFPIQEVARILWSEYENTAYSNLRKENIVVAIISAWIVKNKRNYKKNDRIFLHEPFLHKPDTEINNLIIAIIQVFATEETDREAEAALSQTHKLKNYLISFLKKDASYHPYDVYIKEEVSNLFNQLLHSDVKAAFNIISYAGKSKQLQKDFFTLFGYESLLATYNKTYPNITINHLFESFRTNQVPVETIAVIFWNEWKRQGYKFVDASKIIELVVADWVYKSKQTIIGNQLNAEILLTKQSNALTIQKVEAVIQVVQNSLNEWGETNQSELNAEDIFFECINTANDININEKLAEKIVEYFLKAGLYYSDETIGFKSKEQLLCYAVLFLYKINKGHIANLFRNGNISLLNKLQLLRLAENIIQRVEVTNFLCKTLRNFFLAKIDKQNRSIGGDLNNLNTSESVTDFNIKQKELGEMLAQLEIILQYNRVPNELKHLAEPLLLRYFKTAIVQLFQQQKRDLEKLFMSTSNRYANKFLLYNLWTAPEKTDEPVIRFLQQFASKDFFALTKERGKTKKEAALIDDSTDELMGSLIESVELVTENGICQPTLRRQGEMLNELKAFMQHNAIPGKLKNVSKSTLLKYFKNSIWYLFKYQQFALEELFYKKTSLYENKFLLYDLWVTSEAIDQPVLQFMQKFIEKDFLSLCNVNGDRSLDVFQRSHPANLNSIKKLIGQKNYIRRLLTKISVLHWIDAKETIPFEIMSDLANIPWEKEYKMVLTFFQNNFIDNIEQLSKKTFWLEQFKQFNFLFITKKSNIGNSEIFLKQLLAYIFDKEEEVKPALYITLLAKIKKTNHLSNSFEKQMQSLSEQALGKKLANLKKFKTATIKQEDLSDAEKQRQEINIQMIEKYKMQALREKEQQKLLEQQEHIKEGVYIKNAGIVLLTPFLASYLDKLQLLSEDKKKFLSGGHQQRAMHLLQYLVDGQINHKEFELTLMKIICGFQINEVVENDLFEPSSVETEVAEDLIKHVVQLWSKIGESSITGFRGNFLIRDGLIAESENEFILRIEKRGYDILIQFLPWSFNILKLPWMQKPIITQWI